MFISFMRIQRCSVLFLACAYRDTRILETVSCICAYTDTDTITHHKDVTHRLIVHMHHNMYHSGFFCLHQTKNRGAGGMATSPHLSRAHRNL